MHCKSNHIWEILSGLKKNLGQFEPAIKARILKFISEKASQLPQEEKKEIHLIKSFGTGSRKGSTQPKQCEAKASAIQYTQPTIHTPLNVSNILQNEGSNETSKINSHFQDLIELEKYLTENNIITISEDPIVIACNPCQKCFNSIVDLLVHCSQKHRLSLSDEQYHTTTLLREFPSPPTYDKLKEMSQNLRLDLLFYDRPKLPEKIEDLENRLNVPPFFADLLIEMFGIDRPESEKYNFPKKEWNQDVVWLSLPAPVPIIVTPNGQKTALCVLDTDLISAKEVKRLIKSALDTLAKNKILHARLENVLPGTLPKEELDKISGEDVFILCNRNEKDGAETIKVWIYTNKWTEKKESYVKRTLQNSLNEGDAFKCKSCGCIYSKRCADKSECSGAKIGGIVILKKKGALHQRDGTFGSRLTFEKKGVFDFFK